MIAVLDTVALWIGAAGSVTSLAVYGLSSAWWRNAVGRFLVVYMGVVVLIYVKSTASLLAGTPINTTALSVAINVLVAALMVYQTWTFTRVIVKDGKRR